MYSSETGSNLPTQILRRTNESWNTINFPGDDILSVVSYQNKAYGHDQISIRMFKTLWQSNLQTITFDFISCIESGIFPTERKMVNVVPVHKRDDKQNVNNHRPVSLLRIFGKIFGCLIDNKIYIFL